MRRCIDVTLPLAPGLVDRLKAGIDVADVGCGSGHAINLMAQAFPNSRFTGFDFSEEGVAAGKAEAKSDGSVKRDVREEGRGARWTARSSST